ncbi:MAG: ice-binding family protein [Flavobacteriaceae bacterium]|nr:ice-binding family protein [Flavobacteriaceae bacterium]
MKTKKLLLTTFAMLLIVLINGCQNDDFVEITGQSPVVQSTVPADMATAVPLNQVVTLTFNKKMNPITIGTAAFSVIGQNVLGGEPIEVLGTSTYNDSSNTMSFVPTNPLNFNNIYTATLLTRPKVKDVVGNFLQEAFVWTFSTRTIAAPMVISTDPLDNATGVPIDKTVTATFSEPMDPATITDVTFTLADGTTPITGIVTYSGSTASFNPSADLLAGKEYTATITTGAKNPLGTAIATNHVWTFTTLVTTVPTVISTDPLDNATDVLLNKTVTATFSEPMDPLTITATTFTLLDDGANTITGAITYSGSTASFNPSADLLSGKTYTATITTGAKNPSGIAIATDHVWTFSTGAPAGPAFVDLKSAGQFGILAGVGVSNNAGFSEIRNMDVGISPGVRSSVTGFPPAIVVNGAIFASDDSAAVATMLIQAKQDLTDAYLFAERATAPAPATVAGDQGGLTLAPGIYKSTSTLLIQSGDLTLDAQGDANAVWIFQIAADFTTVGGAGGNVILIGGAQAKNIFWQVGSSATIGDGTIFQGNVLALTSITMNSGATAVGRMLARNGAVVMTNANIIEKP